MALNIGGGPRKDELDVAPDPDGRIADDLYERDTGRSNFAAFLLGGIVVAGGMLAFLYYDSDGLSSRDTLTTGSIGQIDRPAPTLTNPAPATPAKPAPPAMD